MGIFESTQSGIFWQMLTRDYGEANAETDRTPQACEVISAYERAVNRSQRQKISCAKKFPLLLRMLIIVIFG